MPILLKCICGSQEYQQIKYSKRSKMIKPKFSYEESKKNKTLDKWIKNEKKNEKAK